MSRTMHSIYDSYSKAISFMRSLANFINSQENRNSFIVPNFNSSFTCGDGTWCFIIRFIDIHHLNIAIGLDICSRY